MRRLLPILAVFLIAMSCSTTRVLEEGQLRLTRNELQVGDKSFNSSELTPYVKQQAVVSPFVCVYNWGGRSEGALARMWRKIGTAPVVYDPTLVESSKNNIAKHLEYMGYYGSKVTFEEAVKDRKVAVIYKIELGHRYPVDEVRYKLPAYGDFAEEFYADTANVLVKAGDYLSEAVLEAESVRSSAVFRELGYYGFSKNHYFFTADTLTNPGHVILDYDIRDYTRSDTPESASPVTKYRFNDVTISHAKDLPFRSSVLKAMNVITPGDVYRESTVNTTYDRLSALKVFNSVNIEMTPNDSNKVDCSIKLSESNVQGFKVNLEASTNSSGLMGISPQLSYFHKNIFHGGEWLNLAFSGNFQFKFNDDTRSNEFGISAGISLPKFLGLPLRMFKGPSVPRTEFNLAFNYQDRPEYTRNILSASFDYSGSWGTRFFYQFYPVQLNYVRLFNLDEAFSKTLDRNPYMKYSYQNHFDAGVGAMLYYTTNTSIVPKTPYWYSRLLVDLSGNAISIFNSLLPMSSEGFRNIFGAPYSQYVRAELSLGKTIRFGHDDRQSLAGRFLAGAGYAYGNSSSMPYEKQFYCGGAGSMRGWQVRSLGPGTMLPDQSFSIPSQTGDMKLEADLEYRFPLFWKVEGAMFAEAGNVWTLKSKATDINEESQFQLKNFYKSIAADWGLGARIDLDFILLRLDLGMKLRDPSRAQKWVSPAGWLKSNGFAVHFGVGYPF